MARLTTRDYKRTSRSSSAAKLKEFGLGVLVGAVLASAAFLIAGAHARHRAAASEHARAPGIDLQGAAPHAPAPDDATSSNSSDGADGSGSSPRSAASATQPPQYDFYRMLPNFKVPVSHDDAHSSRAPPPPEATRSRLVASGPTYILQVGSYRSAAEADQVRDRLARAGISAQVQRIAEGSRTWNRV